MTDITLNQNVVPQCLTRSADFGGTTIRNICHDTATYVPWGSLDWFWSLFLIAVMVTALALAVVGTAALTRFLRS